MQRSCPIRRSRELRENRGNQRAKRVLKSPAINVSSGRDRAQFQANVHHALLSIFALIVQLKQIAMAEAKRMIRRYTLQWLRQALRPYIGGSLQPYHRKSRKREGRPSGIKSWPRVSLCTYISRGSAAGGVCRQKLRRIGGLD